MSFFGTLFGRFVLIFQWCCWSTRANVLAPLHVVEVRMVFRRAGLISFGRSVCRVALAVIFSIILGADAVHVFPFLPW